jgi:hypothetical protein
MVHGTAVTEPIWAKTKAVAKALAAELALKVLEDESSDLHLSRICDCSAKGSETKPSVDVGEEDEQEERDPERGGEGVPEDPSQKDETEEGFAVLAQRFVEAREGRSSRAETDRGETSDMDISEDEVKVR